MAEGSERDNLDYWKKNISELKHLDSLVLIHVCDENRQITKDFCCKRNILVEHMKYFESFLAENDSGYEDIDISVHCDVEIFEWLMAYIHHPNQPPPLEKALVVSILISSDFLQMESLVDLCISQIAQNLGDIIKLPIDLSCISEKLLNKLAALTPSKLLAATKDRKDKILTKLYKRRVELDFSRKASGPRGLRSIATSLTCCRNCAAMYLDIHSSSLICKGAKAAVAFRGKLVRRHMATSDWSLTHYLKLLHSSGNMNWEQIYWYVWGACVVLRVKDVHFSVSEVHRYTVESDALVVHTRNTPALGDTGISLLADATGDTAHRISLPSSALPTPSTGYSFSLNQEDDLDVYNGMDLRLPVVEVLSTDDAACDPTALLAAALHSNTGSWGSGLNPLRRPDVLCRDIFDLISSQIKFISGEGQRAMIESLARTSLNATSKNSQTAPKTASKDAMRSASSWGGETGPRDIKHELWGVPCDRNLSDGRGGIGEERFHRGRSVSPANRRVPRTQYRQSQSSAPPGSLRGPSPDSFSPVPSAGMGGDGGDVPGIVGDRRSRSSSNGPRRTARGTLLPNAKLPPKSVPRSSSTSVTQTSKVGQLPLSPRGQEVDEPKDPFETLKCFPAEIQGQLGGLRGPIHGIWLTEHPLSTFPYAYYDMLNFVESFSSSALTDAKRREWLSDLLREYDDKRMDRMEDYLLSHRKNIEEQMQFANMGKWGGGSKEQGVEKNATVRGRLQGK